MTLSEESGSDSAAALDRRRRLIGRTGYYATFRHVYLQIAVDLEEAPIAGKWQQRRSRSILIDEVV
jgi:hypothetical protein